MDISALLKYLQRILQISKAIELDIDLSYTKALVLMNLFKKIAIHLQIEPSELIKEFKEKGIPAFLNRINNLILEEFNAETEEYGLLSKEILKVLSGILKSDKSVQDIQLMEFLEKLNDVGLKIEAKFGSDFLAMQDTTPATNQEKSSIIEIESKKNLKKEKKN